jgi:predicted GNAT superfamily acetyltransferase
MTAHGGPQETSTLSTDGSSRTTSRGGDDITIRPLASRADYDACIELQELTWGVGFNERVSSGILKLSQLLGGVASGAFSADGELLGFVFGMSGLMNGKLAHWSDMLAVRPGARDRGIGEALKWHQRERLLEAGVNVAYWTFDPLVARNGWLNFSRLGAVSREYVRDFYDASDSPLHHGLATDRLVLTWFLDSTRVQERSLKRDSSIDRKARSAPLVNPSSDGSEPPDVLSLRRDLDEPVIRVAVPSDVQKLKAESLDHAERWQAVVRAAFEHYLQKGYEVTEMLRDEHERTYVLRRRTDGS